MLQDSIEKIEKLWNALSTDFAFCRPMTHSSYLKTASKVLNYNMCYGHLLAATILYSPRLTTPWNQRLHEYATSHSPTISGLKLTFQFGQGVWEFEACPCLHRQPIWPQLLARGHYKPVSSRNVRGPMRTSAIQWRTGHRWPALRRLQIFRKAVKGSGTAQSQARLSSLFLTRKQPHWTAPDCYSCGHSPQWRLASCIAHIRLRSSS